jgi:hypothetical protein
MARGVLNALSLATMMAVALTISETRAQESSTPAAAAQDAAPAAAPKAKPKRATTVDVVVSNQRSVGLTELDAAPAGGPQTKKIVAKLAPGKKTMVKLARGKDCLYDLHGMFDDGAATDISGYDVCKDKKINLVE